MFPVVWMLLVQRPNSFLEQGPPWPSLPVSSDHKSLEVWWSWEKWSRLVGCVVLIMFKLFLTHRTCLALWLRASCCLDMVCRVDDAGSLKSLITSLNITISNIHAHILFTCRFYVLSFCAVDFKLDSYLVELCYQLCVEVKLVIFLNGTVCFALRDS